MKWFALCLAVLCALLVSCKSGPAAVEEVPPIEEIIPVIIEEPEQTEPEETAAYTQEMYDNTLAEVQHLMEELNRAVRTRNYTSWRSHLSEDYLNEISSPEFLANASESPILKSRRIVLKSVNDYFINVVVPSRANSRVDMIEFVTPDRVKAFYIDTVTRKVNNQEVTETRNLRLYELTKIDGKWKIVN
jgi:hypothetical protein